MQELISIQSELKVTKTRENTSANFKYRSAEDILEALKPLLAKYNCFITLSDEMVLVGDKIYVKATATIFNKDSTISIHATAFAQEPSKPKPNLDESQMTGSASSYARKYALNGLFCIDNGMDADEVTDNAEKVENKKETIRTKAKKTTSKLVMP